jgi:hypothetical protein
LAQELGGAFLVEDVDFPDREAGACKHLGNRPGEVTAAEQALLDRLEAMLPVADPLAGGEPMLDEVQRSARLEHPPQLGQGGGDARDRAHLHVDSAASKLSSSKGSDWPSRPDRSTGTPLAFSRSSASFQARSTGSTAATLVTAAG